ncbi:unnamed protein product, partial [Didymodactylos carnosus]
MRRRLREAGVAVISLLINRKGRLSCRPIVTMPGLLDLNDDAQLINIIKDGIANVIEVQAQSIKGKIFNEQIESAVRSFIRKT